MINLILVRKAKKQWDRLESWWRHDHATSAVNTLKKQLAHSAHVLRRRASKLARAEAAEAAEAAGGEASAEESVPAQAPPAPDPKVLRKAEAEATHLAMRYIFTRAHAICQDFDFNYALYLRKVRPTARDPPPPPPPTRGLSTCARRSRAPPRICAGAPAPHRPPRPPPRPPPPALTVGQPFF